MIISVPLGLKNLWVQLRGHVLLEAKHEVLKIFRNILSLKREVFFSWRKTKLFSLKLEIKLQKYQVTSPQKIKLPPDLLFSLTLGENVYSQKVNLVFWRRLKGSGGTWRGGQYPHKQILWKTDAGHSQVNTRALQKFILSGSSDFDDQCSSVIDVVLQNLSEGWNLE